MQEKTITLANLPYNEFDMRTGRPATQERSAFGKRLHQARLTAGLTQNQIAEKMETTQSAYAAWERENIALKPAQIIKLCSILKIKVENLFEDSPEKRSAGGPKGKARIMFEEVTQLPRRQQQHILSSVEMMLAGQRAKAS